MQLQRIFYRDELCSSIQYRRVQNYTSFLTSSIKTGSNHIHIKHIYQQFPEHKYTQGPKHR